MTVEQLRKYLVVPFDIRDTELRALFSYFLHKAPSIESKSATTMEPTLQTARWDKYITTWELKTHKIYVAGSALPSSLISYGLADDCEIKQNSRAFVCKRKEEKKDKNETDPQCVLRHVRNAIAHGSVYVRTASNEKFILFEDYSINGKRSGLFLFSKIDLENLKKAFTD